MVSLNDRENNHLLVQCVFKVIHGAESHSLDSNPAHSCVLQPVFTWSLCDAHEWCRTAACIRLCCRSLLCVSEALWGCWCLFGCMWTADVYWQTFTYRYTHKLITAPVSLAVIMSLNRNKQIPPGSDVLLFIINIICDERIFSHIHRANDLGV